MKMKDFAKFITTEFASICFKCAGLPVSGWRSVCWSGWSAQAKSKFLLPVQKRRSLSGLAAKVQELHGSEVCLTKLEVFFDKYGTSTAHMCETSAKYVISRLWTVKPKVLGIIEAYFRGHQDGSTTNVSQNWKYVVSSLPLLWATFAALPQVPVQERCGPQFPMLDCSETLNMLKGFVQYCM